MLLAIWLVFLAAPQCISGGNDRAADSLIVSPLPRISAAGPQIADHFNPAVGDRAAHCQQYALTRATQARFHVPDTTETLYGRMPSRHLEGQVIPVGTRPPIFRT